MPAQYHFSLLHADYVQLNQSWNYSNVISPFYRLYLIEAGTGLLSTPEQQVRLQKDHLYLVPGFTLFNQSCPHALSQYYIHIVEESANGNSLFAGNRKLFQVAATELDKACMQRVVALNPGRDLRKNDNPKNYEQSGVLKESPGRNKRVPDAVLLETRGSSYNSCPALHSTMNLP